jgi:hypothetical protein
MQDVRPPRLTSRAGCRLNATLERPAHERHEKNPHRIDTAQRGLDYASSYAAAIGVTTTQRRSARAARGAKLLRGPFLAPGSLRPSARCNCSRPSASCRRASRCWPRRWRATRSGPSQGLPIEDVGVRVAQSRDSCAMTRRDLLEGNCDLDARLRRSPRALVVQTQGVDQLDVEIDGKAMASMAVGEGAPTTIGLAARAQRVQLVGRRQGEVVQQRRFDLRHAKG